MEKFDEIMIRDELSKPKGKRLFGEIFCALPGEDPVDSARHALNKQRDHCHEPVAFLHNSRIFIIDDNKRDGQGRLLDPNGNLIDYGGLSKGFAPSLDEFTFQQHFGPDERMQALVNARRQRGAEYDATHSRT